MAQQYMQVNAMQFPIGKTDIKLTHNLKVSSVIISCNCNTDMLLTCVNIIFAYGRLKNGNEFNNIYAIVSEVGLTHCSFPDSCILDSFHFFPKWSSMKILDQLIIMYFMIKIITFLQLFGMDM